MARVVRRAASASVRRAPSRAIQRRARKHKVIMESVTQEKKKLQSVICFEARAPTGYTFIPAGNPHLTTACKERCRKEGSQIYAVSTTPHTTTHNLSLHVHRIGYHFPSTVVAAVCSELGLYLTSTGKAVPFHTMSSRETRPTPDANKDQLTINTEARDAITDLFPNIPLNDLHQIIKTAFQKGQRKVGTASELPLARRAQLAVVAHIRHLYTDYDKLLKSGSFHEARSTVEQPTLAKLVAWRGDDENGQKALEDVFREVIVISDDDDDSETEEEVLASRDNLDQSVEILSSHARVHDIQTQPVSFVNTSTLDPLRELSEEAPPGFRFVHSVPKKTVDRRGFSRYQAWNRAMTKYGTNGTAHGTEQAHLNGGTAEQQSPRHGKRPLAPARELADSPRRREILPPPLEVAPRVISGPSRFENTVHRTAAAPERPAGNGHVGIHDRRGPLEGQRTVSQQHGTNGRPVLTTQNSSEVHLLDRSPRSVGNAPYPPSPGKAHLNSNARTERIPTNKSANSPVFVNAHKELHSISQNQFGARAEAPIPHAARPGATQDYVLPSIEALDKRKMELRLENMTKRMSLRSVTPKQPGEQSQPGSPDDPNSKRRRLAYHVPPPLSQESRPDPWNARPIAMPVSVSEGLASRGQYRRDDLGPEYRVMDGNIVRREYLAPADPYKRERQVQAPQDARPAMDRIRFADMHSQATAGLGASSRPAYYGDRSPHTRPAVTDPPRASKDSDHPHAYPQVPGAPLDGKLYADGFVRHVDFREVRPVEYFVPRPRAQQPRAGDPIGQGQGQSFRARIPEHFIPKDLSQSHSLPQPPPEQQHLLPASRATHSSHVQTLPHAEAMPMPGNRQPRGQPLVGARERRPGSGPGPKRRVHDPRAFQMAEQSRPIYVQRVESQTPQPMPEGSRHVVIVD
ncbi:hypothetical protein N7481_002798 [Penicillium waksmanii]|uniref:uncharacterized protein n=1 Tax=Penicillium waksmanii TaxID=69791 RepID=UPI00254771F5|nr:uncharacterized protein N7481_002798 [Penicillium waksmanii]KAJ5995821.1 hypothetical protein N7481_002798 [Penicillium waksmanii]